MSRSLMVSLLLSALPLFAQQTATLRGTITNGTTHQPIAGANVTVQSMRSQSIDAKTASDGTYSIAVAPGRWFVQASDSTHAGLWNRIICGGPNHILCGAYGDPIDVAAGEDRGGIDFAFSDDPPYGTIKGTLTRPSGGPASGSGVQFYDPNTGLEYRGRPVQLDGTFSFNLPPRDWIVMSTIGDITHALTDGVFCVDPCGWLKSKKISLAPGATVTANIVVPDNGVTDVMPDNGPESGGSHVILYGAWSSPRQQVKIGTLTALSAAKSAFTIDATTPPGSGDADVTIGASPSFTLPKAFHYIPSGASYLALTAPSQRVRIGSDATVTATIAPVRQTPTTVALSNSNPEYLQMPASISIPAGTSNATFTVHPIAYGGTRITATAAGAYASTLTMLADPPAVTLTIPPHVDTTKDSTGTITIDPAQSTDTWMWLWGLDAFVSAPVVIPAGHTTFDFSLSPIYSTPHFQLYYPLHLGGNVAANATLNGPQMPHISTSAASYHVTVGKPAKGRIVLSDWAPVSMYIPFYTSSTNIRIDPIFLSSGAVGADFTINATAPGVANVTATSVAGNVTFEVDATTDDAAPRRRSARH